MTTILVVITVIISFLALNNDQLMGKLIFNPYQIKHRGQWYRFITSGFIHADWWHLIINMLVLFSFGKAVEFYYDAAFGEKGRFYFILLYFGALLISVTSSYAGNKNNPGYNALGASGAVSAVTFAAIMFNPMAKIYIWGIIGFPGIILGIIYIGYSYYMGRRGGDQINHDAHLWGAVYGALFTVLLKPAILGHFFEQILNFNMSN